MSAIINRDAVQIGDSLKSMPVGKKDWFIGEVVEKRPFAVILRDAERRRWLRAWDEVETIEEHKT